VLRVPGVLRVLVLRGSTGSTGFCRLVRGSRMPPWPANAAVVSERRRGQRTPPWSTNAALVNERRPGQRTRRRSTNAKRSER